MALLLAAQVKQYQAVRSMMNEKGCGKKRMWPILRLYTSIYLDILRKIMRPLRMGGFGLRIKFRTFQT
jgi:hypothetical protein